MSARKPRRPRWLVVNSSLPLCGNQVVFRPNCRVGPRHQVFAARRAFPVVTSGVRAGRPGRSENDPPPFAARIGTDLLVHLFDELSLVKYRPRHFHLHAYAGQRRGARGGAGCYYGAQGVSVNLQPLHGLPGHAPINDGFGVPLKTLNSLRCAFREIRPFGCEAVPVSRSLAIDPHRAGKTRTDRENGRTNAETFVAHDVSRHIDLHRLGRQSSGGSQNMSTTNLGGTIPMRLPQPNALARNACSKSITQCET